MVPISPSLSSSHHPHTSCIIIPSSWCMQVAASHSPQVLFQQQAGFISRSGIRPGWPGLAIQSWSSLHQAKAKPSFNSTTIQLPSKPGAKNPPPFPNFQGKVLARFLGGWGNTISFPPKGFQFSFFWGATTISRATRFFPIGGECFQGFKFQTQGLSIPSKRAKRPKAQKSQGQQAKARFQATKVQFRPRFFYFNPKPPPPGNSFKAKGGFIHSFTTHTGVFPFQKFPNPPFF